LKEQTMAIPWLTVLQAVPWGEVIRNAPKVAEGARALWKKAAGQAAPEANSQASASSAVETPTLAQLQTALQAQEAALADLQAQMRAATQLIRDLADQNAELVRAVETQRRRLRWLVVVLVVLGAVALLVGGQGWPV
jgi:uncharacterized coiled-coil protein SlyX